MSEGSQYDQDYFLRGAETGKSLYHDYRWLPELTLPMAATLIRHLEIKGTDRITDFGCARGYLVRALRELGYDAWGYDVSEWALKNCDPFVREYVTHERVSPSDWIIAKDVLEHVEQLPYTIAALMELSRTGLFVVVPLSDGWNNARYVVPDYERDVTHIHRYTLSTWAAMFMKVGWSVTAAYRVPGIKDNYARYAAGNGFITARRV